MNARVLVIASVVSTLSATVALAGPYDQPWSLVESGDSSDVRKESPVAISKVDGKSTHNPRKSDPLEPGKHTITLHYETARGVVGEPSRELQINLEACMRYRIVAQYESKTSQKWTPKVYPEPIGECASKFKSKDAAKK